MMTINQMLFGYDNGHHLLAASCSIENAERKILEVLSDYSGSIISKAFDGYITGYPLPMSGYYALSMTWMAQELPRPGSVWTHTLLFPMELSSDELCSINILHLFRRPDSQEDRWLTYYNNPMVISEEVSKNNGKNDNHIALSDTAQTIVYLLCTREEKLVIPVDNPDQYKQAFIDIIRHTGFDFFKEISFSTGSFSNRQSYGISLSVQIVDGSSRKGMWKSEPYWQEISGSSLKGYEQKAKKLISAVFQLLDLLQDTNVSQIKVKYLLNLVKNFSNSEVEEILILLSEAERYFNNSAVQLRFILWVYDKLLEKRLFNSHCLLCFCSDSRIVLAERCLIEYLVSKVILAFSHFESKDIVDTIIHLFSNGLSAIGEQVLRVAINQLSVKNFEMLILRDDRIVRSLISANWKLSMSYVLWRQPYELQYEVLSALEDSKQDIMQNNVTIQTLLNIIYSTSTAPIENRIYSIFGDTAIKSFFQWSRMNISNIPYRRWVGLCSYNAKFCINELLSINNPALFLEIISILSPNDSSIYQIAYTDWYSLYRQYCLDNENQSVIQEFSFFLLRIMLTGNEKFPDDLASFAFLEVHKELAENKLDLMKWEKLDRLLPPIEWFKMWDKCKRLRNAAQEKKYDIDFNMAERKV